VARNNTLEGALDSLRHAVKHRCKVVISAKQAGLLLEAFENEKRLRAAVAGYAADLTDEISKTGAETSRT